MIKNKKYFIKSQDCQMNQYDSDKISDHAYHYNMTYIDDSSIDNISLDEKKYRLSKVQYLIRKNSEKYLLTLVNTKQKVLVEGRSKKIKGEIFGRTFTNKIVHFKASDKFLGKCVDVEILKANRSSLYGCM